MLAYTANRPAAVDRRPHPHTMLAIIGIHVALAAVVMSAKMDIPMRHAPFVTRVDLIPVPKAPPPRPVPNSQASHPLPPLEPRIAQPEQPIPMSHPIDLPTFDPPPVDPGALGGGAASVIPEIPHEAAIGTTAGAQLLTPESERKPPYPASKLLNEEEALLTLRLTIDDRGRVVTVDPVGRADTAFLDSARRHLIAHWRYKPAMQDGRVISSSIVIRLRFELDG